MPKEKTPSKQSENPLPKNLLKKKRVSKEADKVESDNENETIIKNNHIVNEILNQNPIL